MNPVLVIGLDGVPLDLVYSLADQGALPNLQALITRGVVSPLRSTMPPTSGPAWSSFITGKRPGKTGVYDFLYRHPDNYTFYPHSARSRTGHSLWSILSDAGRRVGVLNVPMSYPVEAVNGALISGWMTPYSTHDFAYPPGLLDEIQELVPLYHGTGYRDSETKDTYRAELDRDTLRKRRLYKGQFPSGFGRFSPVQYEPLAEMTGDGYPLTLLAGSVLYHSGAGSRSSRSPRLSVMAAAAASEDSSSVATPRRRATWAACKKCRRDASKSPSSSSLMAARLW